MATPHVRKAAALQAVDTAELTALQVNPKNGAKSIPFRRPIRARLGRPDALALRCPFGPPKSFDPTKTDRGDRGGDRLEKRPSEHDLRGAQCLAAAQDVRGEH